MKRIIVVFCVLLFAVSASAKKPKLLTGVERMSVTFFFSQIYGMSENDFILTESQRGEGADFEERWEKTIKIELQNQFLFTCNKYFIDSGIKTRVGDFTETDYSLFVILKKMDEEGSIYADLHVFDKTDKEILKISNIYGAGGKFGSVINLIGDGMRRAGKECAKSLKEYM